MMSLAELLERLDDGGERRAIEAKRGLGDAAEETICAFVNEPDLGGGYLLFGVEETGPDAIREAPASPIREVGERAPSAEFLTDLQGMSPPMPPRDREVLRWPNREVPRPPLRKKDLPLALRSELRRLGKRPAVGEVTAIIRKLCEIQPLTKAELAVLLGRSPKYVAERYVALMLAAGDLVLLYPDNPAHPKQAYRAPELGSESEG